MRRFYSPRTSFEKANVLLGAEETHHLRDVLRLKIGDIIAVFDGEGAEFQCAIEEIGRTNAKLMIEKEIVPASPESRCEITLGAALLKSDKLDIVIQKSVELGVSHFYPIESARSEVQTKYPEKKVTRWRRIALDAAKQCGRAKIMTVNDVLTFDSFVNNRKFGGIGILFSERNGGPLPNPKSDKGITAVIGPEGGWDDNEIESAKSVGFEIVTFGGRILRADTAAIAITALLQNKFGDFN